MSITPVSIAVIPLPGLSLSVVTVPAVFFAMLSVSWLTVFPAFVTAVARRALSQNHISTFITPGAVPVPLPRTGSSRVPDIPISRPITAAAARRTRLITREQGHKAVHLGLQLLQFRGAHSHGYMRMIDALGCFLIGIRHQEKRLISRLTCKAGLNSARPGCVLSLHESSKVEPARLLVHKKGWKAPM